ncbi:hypothetical protein C7S17_5004 [Burkholderia thailandensis]|nr:hypothetical protein [Burkholderia thailandensis]
MTEPDGGRALATAHSRRLAPHFREMGEETKNALVTMLSTSRRGPTVDG